jgi:hypothetical protein
MSETEYREQEIPSYAGNPFIEALPNLIGKAEFIESIALFPECHAHFRDARDEVRAHLIADAFSFFVPLPRHYTLQTAISRMIRRGYVARNPVTFRYWPDLQRRVNSLKAELSPISTLAERSNRAPYGSFSDLNGAMFGITGSGKTLSIKRILSTYTQVIDHGDYHGIGINIRQVVWLHIEAPHKGSTKDLCMSFFRELDRLLGTSYERTHGRGTEGDLLGNMTVLAAVHALGLLIIDELQELSNIKSGGHDALVGFFLRLTNMINVPVLMVGTYKAAYILRRHLRHIRRTTGIGIPEWGPLTPGKEWDSFVKALWRYQYTRTPTPLTPELSDVLFDESQGINDFAVKLYFLAQDRLIATNDGHDLEVIRPGTIRSVSKEYLRPAREILQALKHKDFDKLRFIDDVELPTVEKFMQAYRDQLHLEITDPAECQEDPAAALSSAATDGDVQGEMTGPACKDETPPVAVESMLSRVVGVEANDASNNYEMLVQANFIKSGTEFWQGPKA